MNSHSVSNTFVWELGSFQEYVKTISHQDRIYSPKFWLPTCDISHSTSTDPNIIKNITQSNQPNFTITNDNNLNASHGPLNVLTSALPFSPGDNPTSHNFWQFRMYPNGNICHENYISLFLKAIRTPFEKLSNITSRRQQFLLEIGKLGPTTIISNYNIIHVPTRKQIIKQQIFEYTFEFDKENITCGFPKFCSLDLLFPGGDKSNEIDLFVQVTVLSDDSSRSNILLLLDDDTINNQQQDDCDVEDISDDIEEYFRNESFADIEFLFDCGSTLKAHRIVLATRCNYFKMMLQGGFKEASLDVIPIRDVNYEVYYIILYYIYTGKLMDLNEENAYELLRDSYKHSDLMGLITLKKMIAKLIVKLVNVDNWHEILFLGWQFNDLLLRTKGLKFVKEHWDIIKYSDNLRRLLDDSSVDWIEELFLVANGTAHMVR
ncbi:16954_t:CDS:1 [Funneliformis geosporum]|uniref:16762_t:CDS:1 n=1 Tax=Funneliformis geosporum TaxID=1117311 RepID=A0A9W4SBP6_9GLOM|nr:16954_t:CDS:1 [Funneliformis geosporum]CAI2163911.1 16762_t:CDS:1 [Funneliformis geosporum]